MLYVFGLIAQEKYFGIIFKWSELLKLIGWLRE
jgi:hypothetical protein